MEYHLDASHEKYIKVTVSGIVEKSGFMTAISDLMSHSEYSNKHALWDFSVATLGMNINDLHDISDALEFYNPGNVHFANKSAIIVPGHMHKALVHIFISMSNHLPFEYHAFDNKGEAEAFLFAR